MEQTAHKVRWKGRVMSYEWSRHSLSLHVPDPTVFCSKGDDPETTANYDYALKVCHRPSLPPSLPNILGHRTRCYTNGCFPRGQITTSNSAASALSGSLSFWFNGQQTATALDASGDDATVDECETVSSSDSLATLCPGVLFSLSCTLTAADADRPRRPSPDL